MKRVSSLIILILVFALAFSLQGCSSESYDNMMGTSISLKINGGKHKKAENEIYDMIRDVEGNVSTNISTSTISKINSAKLGESIKLDVHTYSMIDRAYEMYELSDGAFDISIFPLVKLWKFSPDAISNTMKKAPSDEDIDTAKSKVGLLKAFSFDKKNKTITKLIDGAMLDLGAIAKGYVADKAKDILDKYNVKNAIINIGGTLYLYGDKDFRVGIQNPRENDKNSEIAYKINAKNVAISTSGDYERYYLDQDTGERYHHIIDPSTGRPAKQDYSSVTIKCASATDADILSTSCFVLGKEKGSKMANAIDKNIEVIFITSDGKTAKVETYKGGKLVSSSTENLMI